MSGYRRLEDMSTQELLDLYRGLDMEPPLAHSLGGVLRVGETDDYKVYEVTGPDETVSIRFWPTDESERSVVLMLARMVE